VIAVDLARQMLQLYPDTYALVVSTENVTQNWWAHPRLFSARRPRRRVFRSLFPAAATRPRLAPLTREIGPLASARARVRRT
jgi:hypothetical protein